MRTFYSNSYMKKITCFLSMMCLAVCLAFQSCDDGDGYSLGDFTAPQLATVRALGGNAFYLDCDVWGTCWPVNTDMGWYVPIDGQRVVTVFNPLWDNYEGYDHAVKILEIQQVLTKHVERMEAGSESEFGNEAVPTTEDGITIGNGYLNVYCLSRLPFTTSISLVWPDNGGESASMEAAEDGYIHLELRCNTQVDEEMPGSYSLVSYSLNELVFTSATKGIKLKADLEETGEKEWTFDLVQEAED